MSTFSIKVKNKHLILFALLLIVSVGWTSATGKDFLFNTAEEARRSNDPVKAVAYYDKFLATYPNDPRVPEALYWSADLLPNNEEFTASFFPTHSGFGRAVGKVPELPKGAMTREERLWKIYNEYPDHWTNWHVPYKLAEILDAKGDPRAEKLYQQTLYGDSSPLFTYPQVAQASHRIDAAFKLIEKRLEENKPDEAWEILQYAQENLPNSYVVQQQFKKGDILKAKGDFAAARQAYEQVIDVHQAEQKAYRQFRGEEDAKAVRVDSTLEHYKEEVEKNLQMLAAMESGLESAKVSGYVTVNGKPLDGVSVILRQQSNSWSTNVAQDPFATIEMTGADGSFSFEAATETEYEVGIQLNYAQAEEVEGHHLRISGGSFELKPGQEQQVAFAFVPPVKLMQPTEGYSYSGGPLKIAWQPYAGAESYRVSLSAVQYREGGYSSQGSGRLPLIVSDTQVALTEEEVAAIPFGSITADQDGVVPMVYLGMVKAADDLVIHVDALDEENRVLASSGGLYFGGGINPAALVSLDKQNLQEEEELLIDRQYDDAIAKLEARLQKDPDDAYALNLLYRIYYAGTAYKDESFNEWKNQDPAKSLQLLERLVTIDPTPDSLKNLASLYRGQGEKAKAFGVYEKLEEMGAADNQVYTGMAAYFLSVKDDYKKALEYYRKAQNESEQFFGYQDYLALLLASGQCKEAEKLLDGLKLQYGMSQLEKLKTALQAYIDAGWPMKAQADFLPIISPSFAAARAAWLETDTAHAAFLGVMTSIGQNSYAMHRTEIGKAIASFIEEYKTDAPVLVELVEAFAESRHML